MLLLCDDPFVLPLRIIFGNILSTATYPDTWKLANVTPILKKGDKQLIGKYRPISLLPLCGKIFEKIISNNLYKHLTTHHLITKNQYGFRPGDSTTINIKSNANFFADDTLLFSVVNNHVISANELNHDLKVIGKWAYQWKMKFDPDLNKQTSIFL